MGFAISEDVVDDDLEGFNFCVAENYYRAMLGEDFDFLGEGSFEFVLNIEYWLNYDGEINKEHEDEINKIRTGLFMTCKNRTFIDAIVANKNVSFAEAYIDLGNKDVRLFAICMFGLDEELLEDEVIYNGTVLNMINNFCKDKDDYVEFLSKLFTLLDEEYNKLKKQRDKIEFLDVVRGNIKKFKYSCEKIWLEEICSDGFVRKLIYK